MPGRKYSAGSSYRYGFNGKENDNETYGNDNAYNFGERIYDPRLSRWLSVDPLSSKFPSETPYSFTVNNPIRFIDADGQSASVPPFWLWFRETYLYGNRMMTNGAFQRAAEYYGVPTTAPYLPRIGRIFEDAVLRSIDKQGMKHDIYPYPLTSPNTKFIPDVIEDHRHTITEGGAKAWNEKITTYNFEDAIITDAKFTTEQNVGMTEQIKGFIDYLSDHRGVSINGVPTGEKNSDYGMATLIFSTPANVGISPRIIEYAKKKNVNLFQQVAIQIAPLNGGSDEPSAIRKNKLKISEAFPVYIAPTNVPNFDRSKVDNAGGHGVGNNVNINWNQE